MGQTFPLFCVESGEKKQFSEDSAVLLPCSFGQKCAIMKLCAGDAAVARVLPCGLRSAKYV